MDDSNIGNGGPDLGGFGDYNRPKLRVKYRRYATIGVFDKMIVEGIENVHSLTQEFYGANGGIFRSFPRRRASMPLVFRLRHPGETTFFVIARDHKLRTLAVCSGTIVGRQQVAQGTDADAADMIELADHAGETPDAPVLDAANKPPMADSNQDGLSAPPERLSTDPRRRLDDVGEAIQSRLEGRLLGRFDKPE